MFLHSGASLHGHEYSSHQTPPAPHLAPRRILRSALGTPTPGRRLSTPSTADADSIRRPSPALPRSRPSSFHETPTSTITATTPQRQSPLARKSRPTSELLLRRETIVRFEEPAAADVTRPELERVLSTETTTTTFSSSTAAATSEDEASHSLSEAEHSDASLTPTVQRRRRRTTSRRTPRHATHFLLAQAPPLTPAKRILHLRPRILLQLQQLAPDKRPQPFFDVVPGTRVAPLLARKFPRLFKGELGPRDAVVVQSEYAARVDVESGTDEDDQGLEHREMVAVVSAIPRKDDEAEIVLAEGTSWRGRLLGNGSYEFTIVDSLGKTKTARWVRRAVANNSADAPHGAAPATTTCTDYVYKFSLIDPLSRRHPVLATLTPSRLEILDSYTTLSASSGRYPPSRPLPADVAASVGLSDSSAVVTSASERTTVKVDDATQAIIGVSAVWIALRNGQGWPSSSAGGPARAHSRSVSSGDRVPSFGSQHAELTPGGGSLRNCPTKTLSTPKRVVTPPVVASAAAPACSVPATVAARAESTPQQSQEQAATPRRALSSGAAFLARRREKAASLMAVEPAVTLLESEAEDFVLLKGYDSSHGQGRFVRRLRALRDRLTGRAGRERAVA